LAAGVSALPPPPKGITPLTGARALAMPGVSRGVDLNLNQFSLDAAQTIEEGRCLIEPQSKLVVASMIDSFWSCIADGTEAVFEEQDLALLKSIFNPHLSDRRSEGERFVPPDTSVAYVDKLRKLVKEEKEATQKRIEHFLSKDFVADGPGPLFPSSWTPTLQIAIGKSGEPAHARCGSLQPRMDYLAEAKYVLNSVAPAFHKKTEDGTSFRIYRVGSLEVRTTQEHDGEESVGIVFSLHDQLPRSKRGTVRCVEGARRLSRLLNMSSGNAVVLALGQTVNPHTANTMSCWRRSMDTQY